MKLKLKYNPLYTFNLSDVFDMQEIDVIFEARTRMVPEWSILFGEWMDNDMPADGTAERLLAYSLHSVSQDGKTELIKTDKDVQVVFSTIKEEYGQEEYDYFIVNLTKGHRVMHYNRVETKLKNSITPLAPSSNGKQEKQLPSKVKTV